MHHRSLTHDYDLTARVVDLFFKKAAAPRAMDTTSPMARGASMHVDAGTLAQQLLPGTAVAESPSESDGGPSSRVRLRDESSRAQATPNLVVAWLGAIAHNHRR